MVYGGAAKMGGSRLSAGSGSSRSLSPLVTPGRPPSCDKVANRYPSGAERDAARSECVKKCLGIADFVAGAPQQCAQLEAALQMDVSPGGYLFGDTSWLQAHAA
jgi:hypothetical protein